MRGTGLTPAKAPHLFALITRETPAEIPARRRDLQQIRTEKLAELQAKKAVDRANELLDRLEARTAAIAKASAALQRRQQLCCQRAERIKARIIAELEGAALTHAEGFSRTVSISPSPAAVEITDLAAIPDAYMRQPKTPPKAPDKIALKSALEKREKVAGARLTQGVTLRRS